MVPDERSSDCEQALALMTEAAGQLSGILDALLEGASVRHSIGDEGVRLCRQRIAESHRLIVSVLKRRSGKSCVS